MISVLSAVAEIERDNILVQTMEGRKQKAREGKWNGGFAPYGYKLVDGSLFIAEDEVEVIKIIFDKYINTIMGVAAIAAFLNESGYVKKKRQNNTIDGFAASFVKGVIDNPVYCGKLAYGRRKTEKVQGKRNEFHVVKQDEFMVVDGEHEAIISVDEWKAAQDKRKTTGVKRVKTHSLEHEHILTGILKCPGCGANMYGNVNRKRHPQGGTYRDYFYYACKHPTGTTGHKCDCHKQWDRIYNFLIAFDKLYDKLSDAEKKEFMGTFVESIELYPERLENGKFLKHIHFRSPVYYNGTVIDDISWENGSTVETVDLLFKGEIDSKRIRVEFPLDDMEITAFREKATYPQIKEYVLEQTGLKVSSLYISQIKRKCGLDVGDSYNKPKSENAKVPQCPPEKEAAIMDALRHFGMIS